MTEALQFFSQMLQSKVQKNVIDALLPFGPPAVDGGFADLLPNAAVQGASKRHHTQGSHQGCSKGQ